MNVNVKLFAVVKQIAAAESLPVELPDGATVGDLRRALRERHPELDDVIGNAMVAVNSEYAIDATVIDTDAEVAIIPPVSGG